LINEIEQPAIPRDFNLGVASRSDLEALRRNLKTAQANATAFMPRYAALLKTEYDNVEKYALSLHLEKDTVSRFLDGLDKRHAEVSAIISKMLSARADFYRAYEGYVAVLAAEFGTYKVVNGEFIFPLQRAVDRYNVAAHAMTVATKRVADLDEERKSLQKSQQQRWEQFVSGK
jgi:Mg2+ and Co2+ transporter CorA